MSLIFVDLHGTIGSNNWDKLGISQLKAVKLCTRTMSFSVNFVNFVDRPFLAVHQTISESVYRMKGLKECRPKPRGSQTAGKIRDVRVWCHFMPLEKTVRGYTRKKFVNHLMKVVIQT